MVRCDKCRKEAVVYVYKGETSQRLENLTCPCSFCVEDSRKAGLLKCFCKGCAVTLGLVW